MDWPSAVFGGVVIAAIAAICIKAIGKLRS